MGILQNYKEGNMDTLRTISYAETGVQSPYVTKDVNNPPSSQGIPLQINKRIDDTSRIAQMLVDKPGLKHLGNEALLKQSETLRKLQKKDLELEKRYFRLFHQSFFSLKNYSSLDSSMT
jgi:hypothetical protein